MTNEQEIDKNVQIRDEINSNIEYLAKSVEIIIEALEALKACVCVNADLFSEYECNKTIKEWSTEKTGPNDASLARTAELLRAWPKFKKEMSPLHSLETRQPV